MVELEEEKRGGCTASGRYWQVAGTGEALGGRHPCARARQLKDGPAMRLLGQEPLRRGRAISTSTMLEVCVNAAPAQGQVRQRVARFVRRA